MTKSSEIGLNWTKGQREKMDWGCNGFSHRLSQGFIVSTRMLGTVLRDNFAGHY